MKFRNLKFPGPRWLWCGVVRLSSPTKALCSNAICPTKNYLYWSVVVVKWSACLPYTPTIRVRILLKTAVFILWIVWKNENNLKRGQESPVIMLITTGHYQRHVTTLIVISPQHDSFNIFGPDNQRIISAAIASWYRLHLPFCGCRFKIPSSPSMLFSIWIIEFVIRKGRK